VISRRSAKAGRGARPRDRQPRPSVEREGIEAEIDRVRSLGVDSLRTLWRTTFRSSPPPAFSKDILARFLCWHIQEQAFGGLDPKTAKHLGSFARGDRSRADRPRRLKPGTVLLREYQGERHTVTVVAKGYVWREATYASLSIIARAITGTARAFLVSGSTRGPRFHRMQPVYRWGRSTGDILPGIHEPSHRRPPWHKVRATNPLPQCLPFTAGSADHEAGRSKTPANGIRHLCRQMILAARFLAREIGVVCEALPIHNLGQGDGA
jgi:hypothetical protein